MKSFTTTALVVAATFFVAGAESAQAGPFSWLPWNTANYNTPRFSSGTICGPTGCYTPTVRSGANYSPAVSQPYAPNYRNTGANCTTGNCYGVQNRPACPGGVCPTPYGTNYRGPVIQNSYPQYSPVSNYRYNQGTTNTAPQQPVRGSRVTNSQVRSPFYE